MGLRSLLCLGLVGCTLSFGHAAPLCPTPDDFRAEMSEHLSSLHDRLHVNVQQEPKWKTFQQAWMDAIPPMFCRLPPVQTVPERLERDEILSASYMGHTKAIKPSLLALYDTLNDEQKATFDHERIRGLSPPTEE